MKWKIPDKGASEQEVGEKAWQKGMAWFRKPFTAARIRYFEHNRIDEALAWLNEEQVTHPTATLTLSSLVAECHTHGRR